ncbi:MAG: hypothetical protein H0V87_06715 [Chloroflexi bacterium]|nr:hypothetical protein [Chloroflexota bacterium]
MDQLLPRKPQDVDRWSDEAERTPGADPVTGPDDRWANESTRGEPGYPAPGTDDGGTDQINADLEQGGAPREDSDDPLVHGQAR